MSKRKRDISRRQFLEGTGVVLAVATAGPALKGQLSTASPPEADSAVSGVPTTTVRLVVNGTEHRVDVEDRWTLAELLRDHLGLTGTKIGCDRGECGACTVQVDGRAVRSCVLPVSAVGERPITTIEGIGNSPAGASIQKAWLELEVVQCGYCQSGQIMSAAALLANTPAPDDSDIDAAMSGNICRCGTYVRIREAIKRAAAHREA